MQAMKNLLLTNTDVLWSVLFLVVTLIVSALVYYDKQAQRPHRGISHKAVIDDRRTPKK